MDRGDLGLGLVATGIVGAVVGVIIGVVYLVVTVAKWAWGG